MYWLAPVTLIFFAYRAAPLEAGTWLVLVTAAFVLSLVVVQLRRNHAEGAGYRGGGSNYVVIIKRLYPERQP